jgi:hypothetical protein
MSDMVIRVPQPLHQFPTLRPSYAGSSSNLWDEELSILYTTCILYLDPCFNPIFRREMFVWQPNPWSRLVVCTAHASTYIPEEEDPFAKVRKTFTLSHDM